LLFSHQQARDQGGKAPLQNVLIPLEEYVVTEYKTIGHTLKNLGPSQKTLRPLVSQAGYGPGHQLHSTLRCSTQYLLKCNGEQIRMLQGVKFLRNATISTYFSAKIGVI